MSDESNSRELPVTFSAFIVSLATSTMMHLGEGPDPATGKHVVNLGLARNTIDLLGMLAEKTKGNLDEEEKTLLDTLLYETRMKFIEKTKGA